MKNVTGTMVFTKPIGYNAILFEMWVTVSDPIAAGEKIEMNVMIGQGKDLKTPPSFETRAFTLTDTNITAGTWKRVGMLFKGYDARRTRSFTGFIVRRNDSTKTPISSRQVWTLKYRTIPKVI